MKSKLLFLVALLLLITVVTTLIGCTGTPDTTQPSTESTDTKPAESESTANTTPESSLDSTEAPDDSTDSPESSTPNTTTEAPTTSTTPDTTSTPITTTVPVTSTEPPVTSTEPPVTSTEPPVTSTEPEDTTPEPPKGTTIKLTYVVNNPYAGSLSGRTEQAVLYGVNSSGGVSVKTNLGYKFVGWSDGSTKTIRSGDCPKTDTVYTAVFDYDAKELPILSLFTDSGNDVTDRHNYVTGKISVYNAPEGFNFENLAMEIRGRGNYTWDSTFNADPMYNKRPYRLKLSEKKNLLGQANGKAKSWALIANHCDQSLLRNQTVMKFAQSLTGIVWEPSANSVDVYLNGEYMGVYMLAEQVQIDNNKIDLSEEVELSKEVDFLIHRSGYIYKDDVEYSFYYDNEPYEIVSDLSLDPELAAYQLNYIRERIGECWDAIKYGNQKEIMSLIDINSVIDTMIVHELFKNLDTGHDNFYMFAATDGKLFFGPVWDFDQCAGNADVGVETFEGLRGSYENNWYENILKHEWFKEMFLDRWDELYTEDIKAIPDFIREQAKASYNAYVRNFDRWKILGYTDEHGNKQLGYKINREMEHIRIFQTYDEHYEYFAQWMENRMVWLNNYYHSSQFIVEKVELELTGNGTAASPYLITSAKDFYNFTMVMMQGETFQGKYLKQTADIDMTEISYYIGIGKSYVFAGNYNGNGHKINASIVGTDTTFFPYVTGTIMNLMTTGEIRNSDHAAGIARSVRIGGLIINCGSTAKLSSTGGNAGGIVASNETGGGSVIGCWFAGTTDTPNSLGPINVYHEGRQTGVFAYNYYCTNFCPADRLGTATVRNEKGVEDIGVSENQLRALYMTLRQNQANVVSEAKKAGANLSTSDLCSWENKNNIPSPVPMN